MAFRHWSASAMWNRASVPSPAGFWSWPGPLFFFFQAEDGIRYLIVTGVQTCALPIFSSNGQQPAFRDVIVYYNGTAAIDKTLSGALSQFPAFSGITAPPDTGNATQPPANPSARATVDSLLSDANKAYADAQNALKNQDLAGYQQQVQRLGDLLDQLAKARASEQGTTPSSSTSSTTTTTRAK